MAGGLTEVNRAAAITLIAHALRGVAAWSAVAARRSAPRHHALFTSRANATVEAIAAQASQSAAPRGTVPNARCSPPARLGRLTCVKSGRFFGVALRSDIDERTPISVPYRRTGLIQRLSMPA